MLPLRRAAIDQEKKFVSSKKCWIIKYVAGNPEMFSRVTTDGAGPTKRSEALAAAAKVAANGWRVWVEHQVTGDRIFESDVEKAYKHKAVDS